MKTVSRTVGDIGTKSSMSGEKYRIRFQDGRVVDSAQVFREKLAAYQP